MHQIALFCFILFTGDRDLVAGIMLIFLLKLNNVFFMSIAAALSPLRYIFLCIFQFINIVSCLRSHLIITYFPSEHTERQDSEESAHLY